MTQNKKQKGFTLIEILIVIGIIAILATIVIIAINPARQFAQARNTQRTSSVNTILNAVGQYIADNKGVIPSDITTTTQNISKATTPNLCGQLMPTYVPSLPVDPTAANNGAAITDCTTAYDTLFTIVKDASGRITVCAPLGAETAITGSTAICFTR